MRKVIGIATLFLLLGSLLAVAGDNPTAGKISKFVMMESQQVKPGHELTFHKVGVQFKEAAATSCPDCYWLAAAPITGEGGDFGFLVFQDSWADIEKVLAGFEKLGRELGKNASFMADIAEYSAGVHFSIAEFQPDISYQPDKIALPQVTRWQVTVFRLQPGTATEFTGLVKEVSELHKKANDNAHWIAYRYVAGGPGPAYMIVTPMRTLAEMDEGPAPAFKELMTPAVRKHFDELVQKTVAGMQTNLYMADPSLSRPPQSFLAANPDFWTVKEPASTVAKTGKKAKKIAEPAAKK